jgi:hypothetical protein
VATELLWSRVYPFLAERIAAGAVPADMTAA